MRHTSAIELAASGIGTRYKVLVHDYFPNNTPSTLPADSLEYLAQDRAYIQASLHADELPGMLVNHHLIKLLDAAAAKNGILKQITIVPYANPIGLNQLLNGSHLGRFSFQTSVNFNRDWLDVTSKVIEKVQDELSGKESNSNVAIIRKALLEESSKLNFRVVEDKMKQELYKRACTASIVLDLHCDTDAVLHTYTHDRLWPQMADLAAALDSKCNLLAPESGGNPFDEAFSCPWATIADHFPDVPIPMACESMTVELRGEYDVSDAFAMKDAKGIYDFLVRRGYVQDETVPTTIDLTTVKGTPLTGVDMVKVDGTGVITWKVNAGDMIEAGQLLGEVIDIENVDAPRTPITSVTSGIVYGIRPYKLAVPGKIVIKIAGDVPLDNRTGNLLTA